MTAATEVIFPLKVVLNEFLRSARSSGLFWAIAMPALFTRTWCGQPVLFHLSGFDLGGLTIELPILVFD